MHELTRMCRFNSCCLSSTKSHLCDDELTAGRTSQRILILQFIGMKLSIKCFYTVCVYSVRAAAVFIVFLSLKSKYRAGASQHRPIDTASGST